MCNIGGRKKKKLLTYNCDNVGSLFLFLFKNQTDSKLNVKEKEAIKEDQSQDSKMVPLPTIPEEQSKVKLEKVEEREIIKLPVIVKLEKPLENNGEKQITKDESDSFKENVKPVKTELKENKLEPKDLKDVNCNAERAAHESERIELCVSVKTPQEVVERTAEESEKLKNDQQAKIPLKKREIKLTDDYDSLLKGPLRKCITPTKDILKDEGKQEEEAFKRVPTITDGKFLVNGEVSSEKIMPNNKLERSPSAKDDISSLAKEKNGVSEEKIAETISTIVRTGDVGRSSLPTGKEAATAVAEVPLKEEGSPKGREQWLGSKSSEVNAEARSKTDDCLKKPEDGLPLPKECQDQYVKTPSPKELVTPIGGGGLKCNAQLEEKPDLPRVGANSTPAAALPPEDEVADKEDSGSKSTLPLKNKGPAAQDSKPKQESEVADRETPKPGSAQSAVEDPPEAKKEPAKSKGKFKLISEDESSLTENREITSERQKDGIKLTIRISSRKKTDPPLPPKTPNVAAEEEETQAGRILRRSPRISKPTPKIVETRDQKSEKKRSEEEEEKSAALQKQDKKEESKKQEKEVNSKASKVSDSLKRELAF